MSNRQSKKASGNLRAMALTVLTATCPTTFVALDAFAQANTAAGAARRFEVASVKPSTADLRAAATPRSWGGVTNRVTLVHVPLGYVLQRVYDLQPGQYVGPSWVETEFFDIFAVVPSGAPKKLVPAMFQALLEDRFKLKFHREGHVAQVYALVVGEGGPKLKPPLPEDDAAGSNAKITGSGERTVVSATGTGKAGRFKMTISNGVFHYEFASLTLDALAGFLNQGQLDLRVINMTGLAGAYMVPLDLPVSEMPGAPGNRPAAVGEVDDVPHASDPSGASIRGSLQKLGLRLERRRVSEERFVVDHIERTPTEN